MRTYERNGVHVDQCSDCRGIFLDRGGASPAPSAGWSAGCCASSASLLVSLPNGY